MTEVFTQDAKEIVTQKISKTKEGLNEKDQARLNNFHNAIETAYEEIRKDFYNKQA